MMCNKIIVKISKTNTHSYPITIDSTLFRKFIDYLPKNLIFNTVVIVADNKTKKLYANTLAQIFRKKQHKTLLITFPSGEQSKTYKVKQHIETKMLKHHCDRNTLIVALGGGVVGDVAGFTAATYMRGIAYIQVPTTLLAMVDSSVGGKTGINTPQGKNLIGCFWHPKAVLADLRCLETLSKQHIINGLVEIIKIFLTCDAKNFNYVKHNLEKILIKDQVILKTIISHAIKLKVDIVSQDENEQNYRMILNFGHTIGHAIEKISNYKILHGYAVAYGILVETRIAQLLGLLDIKQYLIVRDLLFALGITAQTLRKFSITKIIQATRLDKKIKTGKARYILLQKIGEIYAPQKICAHPVTENIVKQALLETILE